MGILKRSTAPIALPTVLPRVRETGIGEEIMQFGIGEHAEIDRTAASMKQAVKRALVKMLDDGVQNGDADLIREAEERYFLVHPINSNGDAIETGGKFCRVIRLSREDAEKLERQKAGVVIRARGDMRDEEAA